MKSWHTEHRQFNGEPEKGVFAKPFFFHKSLAYLLPCAQCSALVGGQFREMGRREVCIFGLSLMFSTLVLTDAAVCIHSLSYILTEGKESLV